MKIPISRSSAHATPAPMAPMTIASREILMTRGVVVKSPSACAWSFMPLPCCHSRRGRPAPQDPPQSFRQFDPRRSQFLAVRHRELSQKSLSGSRELDQHRATVRFARRALHKPVRHQPVHQLNRTVMSKLQTRGDLAYGGVSARRQSLYGEQQLVLPRFQPARSRLLFAEVEEAPDLIPEVGESLVLARRKVAGRSRRAGH